MDRTQKCSCSCKRCDRTNVTKYPPTADSLFYMHNDFDDYNSMDKNNDTPKPKPKKKNNSNENTLTLACTAYGSHIDLPGQMLGMYAIKTNRIVQFQ